MTIQARMVGVHNKRYIVTISHRSKKGWIGVGDYAGRRIEVVGSSATTAARRWAAAARCKGDALSEGGAAVSAEGGRQREAASINSSRAQS